MEVYRIIIPKMYLIDCLKNHIINLRVRVLFTSCCGFIETHVFLCLEGLRENLGKRSAAEAIHIILERWMPTTCDGKMDLNNK